MRIEYNFGIKDDLTGELSPFNPGQQEFIDNQWNKPNACAWGGVGGGKTGAVVWPLTWAIMSGVGVNALCIHVDQKLAYNVLVQKHLYSQLDLVNLRRQYKAYYGYDPLVKENHQTCEAVIDLRIRWERGTIVYDETVPPAHIEWTGIDKKTGRLEKLAWGGLGWDLILLTQLEMMTEEAYQAAGLRVGRRILPGFMPRLLSDANAKRGHWSKKTFYDRKLRDVQNSDDYYCRKFSMYDNAKHLAPSYIARQEALPDKYRRRVIYGEVDDGGGYVYEAFDLAVHTVPFSQIPFKPTWKLCEFFDWGRWPDPFFCAWVFKDHDGNLFVVQEREHYNTDATPSAKIVLELRRSLQVRIEEQMGWDAGTMAGQDAQSFGPPDMNITQVGSGGNRGPSLTIGDQFLRNPAEPDWRGIYVQTVSPRARGTSGVESSKISALSQMLTIDPEHRNPLTGELGSPRIFLCSECERVIDQIDNAEYFANDEGRANFMNDKRMRNEFAPAGLEATHHWDGEATLRLAAQEFYLVREPETKPQETIFTQRWRQRHNTKRKNTLYA